MNKVISNKNYKSFLIKVKDRIARAQYEAMKLVNRHLIDMYWDIGKMIVSRQKKYKWGKSIVENLSKDLQGEFPGIKGFSAQNLWYMRQFYNTYKGNKNLQPLVGEISWAKHLVIISRCKSDLEREFYIKMTKKFGWTKNLLIHQIDNQSFEKYALNQTNFDKAVPAKYRNQAKLAVKDEYIFDFLELGEEHSERELEIGLLNNIRQFLSEMGGYFTFIGNQFSMEVADDEFYIDLLLYHRVLKSLIAIELKIGDFKPEYAGKMQFYLSALDDKIKLKNENPSIGIIICRGKKRTVVEYTLKDSKKPIGVATYKIAKKLPENIKKYLPTPKELKKHLDKMDDSKGWTHTNKP